MIFGLLPGVLEVFVIMALVGFVTIKTAFNADNAAKGNTGQELKWRQRVVYGPLWLLAALSFVGCAIAIGISADGMPYWLSVLALILDAVVTALVVIVTGAMLSIAWPLPREE